MGTEGLVIVAIIAAAVSAMTILDYILTIIVEPRKCPPGDWTGGEP